MSEVADKDTHFYGLRACSEKTIVVDPETSESKEEAGRLVSVQFYIKSESSGKIHPLD